MDINDIDSPLRNSLSYSAKRVTPAVPIPDWHITSPGRPISSANSIGFSPSTVRNVIRPNTTHLSSPSTSKNLHFAKSNIIPTSHSNILLESELKSESLRCLDSNDGPRIQDNFGEKPTPSTPSRISGDVSFTPTHSAFTPHSITSLQNPHSTIVAHTPVASGPEQAKSSIKLQNCVSTVNLNCELKLLDVYCRTRYSEYNPSRFHGVVMRIFEPRATALVFRSGKLVCTGAKNEHDSLLAARKFARIIQKIGYPVRFTDFKIQNFVATADLRFPIRLEALQQSHGQFTSYEPELFPGLIYRLVRPRIVLLIFVNGKIVFTGGKSRNDITESLNIIYPILRSFKKN